MNNSRLNRNARKMMAAGQDVSKAHEIASAMERLTNAERDLTRAQLRVYRFESKGGVRLERAQAELERMERITRQSRLELQEISGVAL